MRCGFVKLRIRDLATIVTMKLAVARILDFKQSLVWVSLRHAPQSTMGNDRTVARLISMRERLPTYSVVCLVHTI
jgi:hypothetical protein